MNVSACRFGSPMFLSLPHFLHADPELLDLVSGLQPDPEKHSFYFGVEPVSSMLIKLFDTKIKKMIIKIQILNQIKVKKSYSAIM
jgi:hypothetical protein